MVAWGLPGARNIYIMLSVNRNGKAARRGFDNLPSNAIIFGPAYFGFIKFTRIQTTVSSTILTPTNLLPLI